MLTLLLVAQLAHPSVAPPEARDAQRRFEGLRRSQLPIDRGPVRGTCAEPIGGFCYWYDPDATWPPEPAATVTARDRLLMELRAAALTAPDNLWVAGQQVRYFLEAGQPDSALAVTGRCTDRSRWCHALRGLALHQVGRVAEADSTFSTALDVLSPDQRCQWMDLELLLSRASAGGFRKRSCEQRIPVAETVLALAQPLLSRFGNPVRSEYLARQVMVRIIDGTATAHGPVFGRDEREMVLRYGWPVAWSRTDQASPFRASSVVGHEPVPSWSLLPEAVAPPRWLLDNPRARSRFKPPGLEGLYDHQEAQIVRFPRGGNTVVVGVWRAPAVPPFNRVSTGAVLAIRVAGAAVPVVLGDGADSAGSVMGEVEGWPQLASLELQAGTTGHWARHRVVWDDPAPTGLAVSDILLFDPWEGVPDRLAELLPRALAGHAIRRDSEIGLYWEVTSFAEESDSVALRIRVLRDNGPRPLLQWEWAGTRGGAPLLSRSVALNLSRMGPGRYYLEVAVRAGSRTVSTRRALQIL